MSRVAILPPTHTPEFTCSPSKSIAGTPLVCRLIRHQLTISIDQSAPRWSGFAPLHTPAVAYTLHSYGTSSSYKCARSDRTRGHQFLSQHARPFQYGGTERARHFFKQPPGRTREGLQGFLAHSPRDELGWKRRAESPPQYCIQTVFPSSQSESMGANRRHGREK